MLTVIPFFSFSGIAGDLTKTMTHYTLATMFSTSSFYFLSIIFFSLALYCIVWRWWFAPELAVMKWIYIYHAGAGGVEGTAERGKTKRVSEIRRKDASARHALRQSRGKGKGNGWIGS
jgi:hypothetical protein